MKPPIEPKPPQQDSPNGRLGRYGLFRAIANARTPRLRVQSPVGSTLGGGFATLKKAAGGF